MEEEKIVYGTRFKMKGTENTFIYIREKAGNKALFSPEYASFDSSEDYKNMITKHGVGGTDQCLLSISSMEMVNKPKEIIRNLVKHSIEENKALKEREEQLARENEELQKQINALKEKENGKPKN